MLDAINRRAPKHDVGEMLNYMKAKGFKGLNLDLVYGLPLQTLASFRENIQQIIELKPDRIATFSYAHIPWFNAAQKLLDRITSYNVCYTKLLRKVNRFVLHERILKQNRFSLLRCS